MSDNSYYRSFRYNIDQLITFKGKVLESVNSVDAFQSFLQKDDNIHKLLNVHFTDFEKRCVENEIDKKSYLFNRFCSHNKIFKGLGNCLLGNLSEKYDSTKYLSMEKWHYMFTTLDYWLQFCHESIDDILNWVGDDATDEQLFNAVTEQVKKHFKKCNKEKQNKKIPDLDKLILLLIDSSSSLFPLHSYPFLGSNKVVDHSEEILEHMNKDDFNPNTDSTLMILCRDIVTVMINSYECLMKKDRVGNHYLRTLIYEFGSFVNCWINSILFHSPNCGKLDFTIFSLINNEYYTDFTIKPDIVDNMLFDTFLNRSKFSKEYLCWDSCITFLLFRKLKLYQYENVRNKKNFFFFTKQNRLNISATAAEFGTKRIDEISSENLKNIRDRESDYFTKYIEAHDLYDLEELEDRELDDIHDNIAILTNPNYLFKSMYNKEKEISRRSSFSLVPKEIVDCYKSKDYYTIMHLLLQIEIEISYSKCLYLVWCNEGMIDLVDEHLDESNKIFNFLKILDDLYEIAKKGVIKTIPSMSENIESYMGRVMSGVLIEWSKELKNNELEKFEIFEEFVLENCKLFGYRDFSLDLSNDTCCLVNHMVNESIIIDPLLQSSGSIDYEFIKVLRDHSCTIEETFTNFDSQYHKLTFLFVLFRKLFSYRIYDKNQTADVCGVSPYLAVCPLLFEDETFNSDFVNHYAKIVFKNEKEKFVSDFMEEAINLDESDMWDGLVESVGCKHDGEEMMACSIKYLIWRRRMEESVYSETAAVLGIWEILKPKIGDYIRKSDEHKHLFKYHLN